jgi:branched-chain amino acid transport system substrate-binding protein
MWQLGEQQLAAGKRNDAIITFEHLAQAYPANAIACRALGRVGRIYLDQGQPSKSLRYYQYLLSTYPQWEDADNAQVDWLRALWATGDKKAVFHQAPAIHQRMFKTDAKLTLCLFIANCYAERHDVEAALDWLAAGFPSARTANERNNLNRSAKEILEKADSKTLHRLLSQNPSDYLRVFLEFRLAQLELANGQTTEARNRLLRLQSEAKNHPLAGDIRAALPGTLVARAGAAIPQPSEAKPSGRVEPITPQPVPRPAVQVDTSIPFNPNRIGCLVPINGQYAAYGRQVINGLSMAAEEYNQRHPDQPITIVTKDTQDDAETTRQSFQELTRNQGVLGIVGPLSSQCLLAVAEPANQLGVPLLTLTQPDESTADNPYVFHVFLDIRQMVKSLVQYCRTRLNYKNFAVLHPDDRYGQRLAKAFADEVQAAGGSLQASVSYSPSATEFQEPIQKLLKAAAQKASPTDSVSKGLPIDALFLPDQARTVSLLAPQLPHNNVVGVQLLGTNLWANPELVRMGGIYVEQAIFPTAYLPGSSDPKAQRFEERFKQMYQTTPSYLEAQAYDAMRMLLQAMEQTRAPLDRLAVVDALRQIKNFDGITGNVSFAATGQPERRYTIFQVQGGQIVPITK